MSLNLLSAYASDSDEEVVSRLKPIDTKPVHDSHTSLTSKLPPPQKPTKRKVQIEWEEVEEEEQVLYTKSSGIFAALPPPKSSLTSTKPKEEFVSQPKKQKVEKLDQVPAGPKAFEEEDFFTIPDVESQPQNLYSKPTIPTQHHPAQQSIQPIQTVEYVSPDVDQVEEESFEEHAIRQLKGRKEVFDASHVEIKEVNQSEQTRRTQFEIEMAKEMTKARKPSESSFKGVEHDGRKRGRGHILDLVLKAKDQEMELKEQYANQKASKKASGAKYGF